MLNAIAVDDERLVLDLLASDIEKVPFLHLVAKCKNAMEASAVLHSGKIDLIFLDIQMPGLSGLEFIRTLQNPPMVIFVTAYKDHAFDGFDLNAVDYLLKPVSFQRFLKACNKAYDLFNLKNEHEQKEGQLDYFFANVEYNLIKVSIPEILYAEGMKDYIKIFISSSPKPIITKMSIKALEEKLEQRRFARVHKSYIVAADKITAIKRDLIYIGTIELPLSANYKAGLEAMLSL